MVVRVALVGAQGCVCQPCEAFLILQLALPCIWQAWGLAGSGGRWQHVTPHAWDHSLLLQRSSLKNSPRHSAKSSRNYSWGAYVCFTLWDEKMRGSGQDKVPKRQVAWLSESPQGDSRTWMFSRLHSHSCERFSSFKNQNRVTEMHVTLIFDPWPPGSSAPDWATGTQALAGGLHAGPGHQSSPSGRKSEGRGHSSGPRLEGWSLQQSPF